VNARLRDAVIVGTGLIGTSAALALRRRGVDTYLLDTEAEAARTAASMGAGKAGEPPAQVDLAVLAVPPALVAPVLAHWQHQGLARSYTDVASVKTRPQAALEDLGCDRASFVGGHPLAGRERSGPESGRADLFEGRPWVLTPSEDTTEPTLGRASALASLCGAVPIVMDAASHDHAVALVSHTPHLVATLMAARLVEAEESAVRLSGQGIRDVTRVAASDPRLWTDILTANAAAVSDILDRLSEDLRASAAALRSIAAAGAGAPAGPPTAALTELLERGNAGHARIPGKHGRPPTRYTLVPVAIPDRPGALATLFADAGEAGVNIEDVTIEHSPGQPVGVVQLWVQPAAADALAERLRIHGWTVDR
jgi:prephenate dehydrogenase